MVFASGLSSPEGPVAMPDGSWLVVEMGSARGCVSQISSDGRNIRTLARTGRPNGLAVDRQGTIWVAESKTPALLRMNLDGKVDVFLNECNGLPFLFPNDLCLGPDGLIYLTDSGILADDFVQGDRIRPDYDSLWPDGRVFQIDPQSRRISLIDRGLRFTNGIAFGPDQNVYVNETLTGHVYRYEFKNGKPGPRRYFGNVLDPSAPPGYKGPDGMKFGADGNLYCTVYGQQGVTVLNPEGQVIKRIHTLGSKPTNLAFGLPGDQKIYVTELELGRLEMYEAGTEGLPLYK